MCRLKQADVAAECSIAVNLRHVCLCMQAAAKRYKVTGTGKVLTRRPGKQHINEKKSPKRLKQLGKLKGIAGGDMIKVKKCLPYAGL